jgi:hypothetical protein
MVVLFGLTSRPGLPCLRAAVASYLLHCVAISASFLLRLMNGSGVASAARVSLVA